MNEEKKGALKNILSDLFVSKYPGDIVPSFTFKDIGVLFKKNEDEDEDEVTPQYEEVTGVEKERVQRRYSQLRNNKNLERTANDILKTLLEIRQFDYNRDSYKDSLREYHSIVEARRHKEVLSIFKDAVVTDKQKKKIDRTSGNKSNLPLLLGGLAIGAGLIAFKSYAKEIEDLFDEDGSEKELEDIEKTTDSIENIDKELDTTPNELDSIEKELDSFDASFTELDSDNFDLRDIPEVDEEEDTPDLKKMESEIDDLQKEIKKNEDDLQKEITENEGKIETGTARAGSATAISSAGSATAISSAGSATAISSAGSALGTSTAGSALGTSTAGSATSISTSTSVKPITRTDYSINQDSSNVPQTETGTARAGSALGTSIAGSALGTSTTGSALGTSTTGSVTSISTSTSTSVEPITRTNDLINQDSIPQIETGTYSASSRSRIRFGRVRPDETPALDVTPDVRFGGFRYQPTVTIRESVKPGPTISGATVTRNAFEKNLQIQKIIESGSGFVVVQMTDGRVERRTGTANMRHNNPGNIEYGEFALSMGAVPFPKHILEMREQMVKDKTLFESKNSFARFAVFPDYETGRKAKEKLIFEQKESKHKLGAYGELTLDKAIEKYAPPNENPTAIYIKTIRQQLNKTGLSDEMMNRMKMKEYTEEQRKIVLNVMEEVEGGRNRILQRRELTTEESEKLKSRINLKNVNEPTISKKVNEISKQNSDSKRTANRGNTVVVQQNNNTTVVNKRTVTRPVNTQPNNNPGLR
jgi:hypothetical protein